MIANVIALSLCSMGNIAQYQDPVMNHKFDVTTMGFKSAFNLILIVLVIVVKQNIVGPIARYQTQSV